MNAQEARIVLDLGFFGDFTAEQLKSAHRAAALRFHPDTGGDPERFREVQSAFELLRDGGYASANGHPAADVEGRARSEFGRGDSRLPRCDGCSGRGFHEVYEDTFREPCRRCSGRGIVVRVPCKFCGGKGCARCRDTGWFYLKRPGRCHGCGGVGWTRGKSGRAELKACPTCGGTGRRKPFNPVIPAGAILRG